jgi:membrane protein implicated in regulation of membrane protease activity
MAARAARAVLRLLWLVVKSFLAFLLFLICLAVTFLLAMVITDAVGLDDYAVYVLWVVYWVLVVLMIRRKVHGKNAPDYGVGPGSEVGLRIKVMDELSRLRRKPPSPHP